MSKRTATRELTHDNWEAEDEQEEMGTFRQASADQLAGRNIKKAKRRGTNGEQGSPSVFKGLSVFSGFNNVSASSTPPAFSFLSNSSKESSEALGKLNSSAKSDTPAEKNSQPLKVTQDSVLPNVKGGDGKANGFLGGKEETDKDSKKESMFMNNLKALNEGVLVWIQKHVDKNPHVNLTPVFDDYKKHFSELLEKYPEEGGSGKDQEGGAAVVVSRKDSASGKENTPLINTDTNKDTTQDSKESSSAKPFSFGIQSPSTEKNCEGVKPVFSFGSSSGSDGDKKSESPSGFSFKPFSSNTPKSEGLVFGNSNSNSSSGGFFGSFNASGSTNTGTTGFSFSSSVPTPASDTKDSGEKTEDPSDEPPKVEVNEIKEEDALYEKKCKLFYMKDGSYVDRGVGTLFLKSAGEKTQLLVRAYTNLGNILLNIILNSSIPCARAGKNGVLIVCIPNPPLESNAEKSKDPVKMLIRVKTSEDADTLLEKIEEFKK